MKKLLNKLSNSQKLEDDHQEDEEILDTNFRKSSTLPADQKDSSEEIKLKRSLNKKALVKSNKDSLDFEEGGDFSNKKKGSGSLRVKNEKNADKDKLHESDGLKKSSSVKAVSIKKSSDKVKDPDNMKSPSLKSVYVSEDEQPEPESEESDEDDAAVPKRRGNSDEHSTTLLRVPSSSSSPSPRSMSSPPPRVIALSPRSPSPTFFSSSSPAPQPTFYSSPSLAPPPSFYSSPSPASPAPRLPTSPAPASAASPHVVMADEFDATFAARDRKAETDETAFSSEYGQTRSDHRVRDDDDDDDAMMMDGDDNKKGKSGLFSFGGNKPRKLKA